MSKPAHRSCCTALALRSFTCLFRGPEGPQQEVGRESWRDVSSCHPVLHLRQRRLHLWMFLKVAQGVFLDQTPQPDLLLLTPAGLELTAGQHGIMIPQHDVPELRHTLSCLRGHPDNLMIERERDKRERFKRGTLCRRLFKFEEPLRCIKLINVPILVFSLMRNSHLFLYKSVVSVQASPLTLTQKWS